MQISTRGPFASVDTEAPYAAADVRAAYGIERPTMNELRAGLEDDHRSHRGSGG